MKRLTIIAMMFAVTVPGLAAAQANDIKSMGMKDASQSDHTGMDAKSCQDMMKGMDMKGMDMKNMDAKSCQNMMTGMGKQQVNKSAKTGSHNASGTVTAVDPGEGTVTLAHGPIKSLNWPAMTMGFSVKDKTLFDKLSVGKKVDVEIVQQDGKYVITAVK